jgi:hypothetical protein
VSGNLEKPLERKGCCSKRLGDEKKLEQKFEIHEKVGLVRKPWSLYHFAETNTLYGG